MPPAFFGSSAAGPAQARAVAGRCRSPGRAVSESGARLARFARAVVAAFALRAISTGGRPAGLRAVDADPADRGICRSRRLRCRAGWRRCGTIRSPNSAQRAAASRAEESSTPALAVGSGRFDWRRFNRGRPGFRGRNCRDGGSFGAAGTAECDGSWIRDRAPASWRRLGQSPLARRDGRRRSERILVFGRSGEDGHRGWFVVGRRGGGGSLGGGNGSNACRGRSRSPGCC